MEDNNEDKEILDKSNLENDIQVYLEGLKKNPNNSYILTNLAHVYRQYKEYDKALEALEIAIKRNPGNLGTLVELAYTYCALGQYDKAINAVDQAIFFDPEDQDKLKNYIENECNKAKKC